MSILTPLTPVQCDVKQAFGQGPAIQERLMAGGGGGGASVASSAAANCGGGPMQQYYNSSCGGDGGQQSYMHMAQSQSMTFSQQRARLLSAGASPTNIRPPANVQQPAMNSEHHMLPQHMNRAPVSFCHYTIGGGGGTVFPNRDL